MAQNFTVTIAPPKVISLQQERDILRKAVAKSPKSLVFRQHLGALYVQTDQFDDAVSLLEPTAAESNAFEDYELLIKALLSRATDVDTRRALVIAHRAESIAAVPHERARALTSIGRAQRRLGLWDAAHATLREALRVNPADWQACHRLTTLLTDVARHAEVVALTDDLLASEVRHSHLFAARALAFVHLGDEESARATFALDRFLHCAILAPPTGWQDLTAFLEGLASELLDHPALSYERYGSAAVKSLRVNEPSTGKTPHVATLLTQIATEVETYVPSLLQHNHPFANLAPKAGHIANWCVIAESEGYEDWHMHPDGWLSGVYYVAVPSHIGHTNDHAGHLAFGLPDDVVGASHAKTYGVQTHCPEPGMLMLFPSHCYHRTYPHGGSERRICFAFDICPRRGART